MNPAIQEAEVTVKPKKVKVTSETIEAPVKKERKPREKVRSIEEIVDLDVKKLTDKEKNNLITYLREQLSVMEFQHKEQSHLIDSTFSQRRMDEENYKAMENYYKTALKSVALQMDAAYSAVKNITGGVN